MLARILHIRGFTSTVFEQEASALERPQGGTLDLHPGTGQYAIQLAELEPQFRAVARYEDQELRLYDQDGVLHFEEAGEFADKERPEIDRTALRQILLDSLPPDTVRWHHKLRTLKPREDGTHELIFENDHTQVFDLVVGADGTWSRVRPLLSAAIPEYTGVTFIELSFDDVDARHPNIAHLVGHGTMFASGNNRALVAQRNGHAHVRVYAALRVPEDWPVAHIDVSRPEKAKEILLEQFAGWSPQLLALITESRNHIVPRSLYALPVGHRWENRLGITLLGDAAHVMSPASGQGVNLALRDAADLACALVDTDDWKSAVRRYEKTMLDRAEVEAAGAAEAIKSSISPEGLEHSLKHMQSYRPGTDDAE